MTSKVAAILCQEPASVFCTDCELDHTPQRIDGAWWGSPDGASRFQCPGWQGRLALYCASGLVFLRMTHQRRRSPRGEDAGRQSAGWGGPQLQLSGPSFSRRHGAAGACQSGSGSGPLAAPPALLPPTRRLAKQAAQSRRWLSLQMSWSIPNLPLRFNNKAILLLSRNNFR